jgi:peroxiredoxin
MLNVMSIETGTRAPDFSLTDAGGDTSYSLSEALERGPAIIGIYKSSCQASKTMFPMLERIRQAYPEESLTILGVSQDSPNVTRSFTRRTGVSFPMLVETEGYPVSSAYDIGATPTVYLIDRDGTVVWQGLGFQKPAIEELNAAVAKLLGTEPVDILEGADDIPAWVPG